MHVPFSPVVPSSPARPAGPRPWLRRFVPSRPARPTRPVQPVQPVRPLRPLHPGRPLGPRFGIAVAGSAVLALALAARPVAAADCGADYVRCIGRTTGWGDSGVLHEQECWSAYWRCTARQIYAF